MACRGCQRRKEWLRKQYEKIAEALKKAKEAPNE